MTGHLPPEVQAVVDALGAIAAQPGTVAYEQAVKLLHGFKRWAKAAQAAELSVHVTSGYRTTQTDRLLRRMGFRITGGNYALAMGSEQSKQSVER